MRTYTAQQLLQDVLFIDIETVSCAPDYQALEEALKPLWDQKAAMIRKDATATASDLFFDKAAIYAEFGKVIVIGLGFVTFDERQVPTLRVKTLQGHDEKALLQTFQALLETRFSSTTLKLCAHNGKEFDFPYLCRRMIVHEILLPQVLKVGGKKPWEVAHWDTMELWKFGDRKSYTSLHLLATLLDIPSSKTLMEGSEVNHYYYRENALDKIAAYCLQDVIVTVQVFLKLHSCPLIPSEHIVTV